MPGHSGSDSLQTGVSGVCDESFTERSRPRYYREHHIKTCSLRTAITVNYTGPSHID